MLATYLDTTRQQGLGIGDFSKANMPRELPLPAGPHCQRPLLFQVSLDAGGRAVRSWLGTCTASELVQVGMSPVAMSRWLVDSGVAGRTSGMTGRAVLHQPFPEGITSDYSCVPSFKVIYFW